MEFAPHNMSSATSPAPYVVSDSGNSNPPCWKAFDGSNTTAWMSGYLSTDWWLSLSLGAESDGAILLNYDIVAKTPLFTDRPPKNWTMQGSNDGVSWNVIDTVTNQTGWTAGQSRNFTCDVTTTPYLMFKIVITATNGSSYAEIGEIYLYADVFMKPAANYLIYRGRDRTRRTYSTAQSSLIGGIKQYLGHRGRDRFRTTGVSLGS